MTLPLSKKVHDPPLEQESSWPSPWARKFMTLLVRRGAQTLYTLSLGTERLLNFTPVFEAYQFYPVLCEYRTILIKKRLYYGGKLWRLKNHVYCFMRSFESQTVCYMILWETKVWLCNSRILNSESPPKFFKIHIRKVHFPSFWMDMFNPKLLLKSRWKVALWYFLEPNAQLWEPKAVLIAQSFNSVSLLKGGSDVTRKIFQIYA